MPNNELLTLSSLSDEEVLLLINEKKDKIAQEYLIDKYKGLVRVKARAYFIIGADKEDIIQEGMIGLYKAIRDYNHERQVSFSAFAEVCVTRQIITAIKAATRQKHIPLNSYISLNKPFNDDESEKTSFLDLLSETRVTNPEELFIGREEKSYIESHMGEALSKLEQKVLSLYLQGISYSDIAKKVDKDEKAIDNALQRVRKKVYKIIQARRRSSDKVI